MYYQLISSQTTQKGQRTTKEQRKKEKNPRRQSISFATLAKEHRTEVAGFTRQQAMSQVRFPVRQLERTPTARASEELLCLLLGGASQN